MRQLLASDVAPVRSGAASAKPVVLPSTYDIPNMPGKRTCIFCEDLDGRLTLEHAYPNWILEVLPGEKPGTTIQTSSKLDKIRAWASKGQTGVRTRSVCEKCNNGWMSKLEEVAKPLLGPLMLGETKTLDVVAQRIAIVWGLKTAMVFDASSFPLHRMVFTAEERRFLREYRAPHPTLAYAVFLAHNKGGMEMYSDEYKLAIRTTPLPEGDDPWNSSVTVCRTLVLGQLVMQVMVFRMKSPGECAVIDAEVWAENSIDITRPSKDVSWPPKVALATPLDLALFRDRWEPETVKQIRRSEIERLRRKLDEQV